MYRIMLLENGLELTNFRGKPTIMRVYSKKKQYGSSSGLGSTICQSSLN